MQFCVTQPITGSRPQKPARTAPANNQALQNSISGCTTCPTLRQQVFLNFLNPLQLTLRNNSHLSLLCCVAVGTYIAALNWHFKASLFDCVKKREKSFTNPLFVRLCVFESSLWSCPAGPEAACVRIKANLFHFVQTATTVTTSQPHQGLLACRRRALYERDSSSHSPLPGVASLPPDAAVRRDGDLACSETKVCVGVKQLFTLFELHHRTRGRPPTLEVFASFSLNLWQRVGWITMSFYLPSLPHFLPPASSSGLPLFCASSTSFCHPSRLLRHLSCLPLCSPLE